MADVSSDHDILIRLETKVNSLTDQWIEFIKQQSDLASRVTVLEKQDSRDSERFRGIAEDIRRSLANAEAITSVRAEIEVLRADLNNMGKIIDDLKKKSDRNDALNAVLATGSGIIGFIFGNK